MNKKLIYPGILMTLLTFTPVFADGTGLTSILDKVADAALIIVAIVMVIAVGKDALELIKGNGSGSIGKILSKIAIGVVLILAILIFKNQSLKTVGQTAADKTVEVVEELVPGGGGGNTNSTPATTKPATTKPATKPASGKKE